MEKKVSDTDRKAVDYASLEKRLAEVLAEKAAVEAQLADLKYRNLVLQTYVKYGLSLTDVINPDGSVTSPEQDGKEEQKA